MDFVEAKRGSVEEDPAKTLATEECGDLVRGGFLRKGNTEEQPSLLARVMFE